MTTDKWTAGRASREGQQPIWPESLVPMVEGSVAVTHRQRKKITRVYMCLSFHILKNLYIFDKRNTVYQVQSQDMRIRS